MRYWVFLALFTSACLLAAPDVLQPSTTSLPKTPSAPLKSGSELTILDNLIEVTKKNLQEQIELRSMVADYLRIHEQYVQDTANKELSYQMIMKAHAVLQKIKDDHLTQAFDKEFINDITFFSNIASRWNKTPAE